jgi:hypothetical protein
MFSKIYCYVFVFTMFLSPLHASEDISSSQKAEESLLNDPAFYSMSLGQMCQAMDKCKDRCSPLKPVPSPCPPKTKSYTISISSAATVGMTGFLCYWYDYSDISSVFTVVSQSFLLSQLLAEPLKKIGFTGINRIRGLITGSDFLSYEGSYNRECLYKFENLKETIQLLPKDTEEQAERKDYACKALAYLEKEITKKLSSDISFSPQEFASQIAQENFNFIQGLWTFLKLPANKKDLAFLQGERIKRIQHIQSMYESDPRVVDGISEITAYAFRLSKSIELPAAKRVFYFSGPPGVGKTVLANAIACALNIPIVKLNFKDLDSYEGHYSRTGWEALRQFEKPKSQTLSFSEAYDQCGEKSTVQILLVDEFDKILNDYSQGDQYRKFFLDFCSSDTSVVRLNDLGVDFPISSNIIIFTGNIPKDKLHTDIADRLYEIPFSGMKSENKRKIANKVCRSMFSEAPTSSEEEIISREIDLLLRENKDPGVRKITIEASSLGNRLNAERLGFDFKKEESEEEESEEELGGGASSLQEKMHQKEVCGSNQERLLKDLSISLGLSIGENVGNRLEPVLTRIEQAISSSRKAKED